VKHAQINMSLTAVWNMSWKIRKKIYMELDYKFQIQIQFQIRDWNKKNTIEQNTCNHLVLNSQSIQPKPFYSVCMTIPFTKFVTIALPNCYLMFEGEGCGKVN
jgi:hypothetical protein